MLIENFLPGRLAGFGLGLEALRELNPRLITASISGFKAPAPGPRAAVTTPVSS